MGYETKHEIKRIMPQEVLDAYRETGMKPITGLDWDGHGCGCALGAITAKTTARYVTGGAYCFSHMVLDQYGYEPRYLAGFMSGFDGSPGVVHESLAGGLGLADGEAAHVAVEAVYGPITKSGNA